MDSPQTLDPDQLPSLLRERLLAAEDLAPWLERINPIDVAHALADLEAEEIPRVFDALTPTARAEVLAEADPQTQALLLLHVGERGPADLVAKLGPDDPADVLNLLEPPQAEGVLKTLEASEAAEIRDLRQYPPETAGGLMTPDLIAVRPEATDRDVLAAIRSQPDAETINLIYVVGPARELLGVLSIRDLLMAPPGSPVAQIMTREIIRVRASESQEEIIRTIETYHLGALPVVDERDRLLGIVTAHDALTALEAEASEDVLTIAGSTGNQPTRQSILARVRARLPWLLITLGGGLIASVVIRELGRWFGQEDAVGQVGRYLPLVAGMAGNVAMQSAAVMVRGFATGEIAPARLRRIVLSEVAVASLVGILCGLAALGIALGTGVAVRLAGAVGLTIASASTLAGVSGTVIPAICVQLGIDPAISAGPFITTLNDLLGFMIYMTVALTFMGAAIG